MSNSSYSYYNNTTVNSVFDVKGNILNNSTFSNSTLNFPRIELAQENLKLYFEVDTRSYPKGFFLQDLIELFYYHNFKVNLAGKENNTKVFVYNDN